MKKTIYQQLKEVLKPEEIDNHAGDLYCKVTPESRAIINGYEFKSQVETFIDNINEELWYDIPFSYDPYYLRKRKY